MESPFAFLSLAKEFADHSRIKRQYKSILLVFNCIFAFFYLDYFVVVQLFL